ncbi:hypothetical protein [Ferrimonas lipolytica]|uniref:Carboxypeptidase regulatory-like domain-containing protein n=1 Tax=Ferrimonas lipolytica TaxID=2724191 RepID=A0A6H1UG46_9GAMM|nr:hypothetical protein [Ferrimonas lipolytica]QIZ78075.1 hypothetical protein HER31_14915 [Ferrimonas lipolytica]
MKKALLSAVISAALLVGCGSDSNSSSPVVEPTPTVPDGALQGTFIDAAVVNIGYTTETISGVTDANGNYNYMLGETVTFAIGAIELPPVLAKGVVTPLDLVDTHDVEDDQVSNIIRLLQSLDDDGDASNGITITDDAIAAATVAVDFDVPTAEFEANDEVLALVAAEGSNDGSLVSAEQAQLHLETTLNDEDIIFGQFVGTWAITEETENDYELLMFTFFDDGTYLHYEVQPMDEDDLDGFAGAEWGHYTVDDADYLLQDGDTMHDSNGNWGLGDLITGAAPIPSDFGGETVKLSFENDGAITFHVTGYEMGIADGEEEGDTQSFDIAAIANNGLLGTWVLADSIEGVDLLTFTFLDDGRYVHVEVADGEEGGMEVGNYEVDSDTNELTVTMVHDLNGDIGLTSFVGNPGNLFVEVNGDSMTLTVNEDGAEQQLMFSRHD